MFSDSDIKFIQQLEEKLGLTFFENESEGNLCFLENNADLKNEFKSGFTFSEFQFFLASFENETIKIPNDVKEFWERVEKGKNR